MRARRFARSDRGRRLDGGRGRRLVTQAIAAAGLVLLVVAAGACPKRHAPVDERGAPDVAVGSPPSATLGGGGAGHAGPNAMGPSPAEGTAGRRSALGVNIGEVNYYTPQIVFLDLMKQAQDWGLNSEGSLPPVDARGWPKALAPGRAAGFMARSPAAGKYVVLYEGEGELEVSHGGQRLSEEPGRYEIDLDEGAVGFTIRRTNSGNPMRNIRIVPIENEQNHADVVFNPRFLERVRPFSTLRFLDFLRINDSQLSRWAERPRPDDFSQGTAKGAALEYAVMLCNRVRADCWINIPHMADDDYIKNAAALVARDLDKDLRVFVEYSNEIWNFAHGDWVQKAGERVGMPSEWDTRLRYQARRSKKIFQAFESALGRERLVRVLAGQTWTLRLQILLDADRAYKDTDAIAVAPYFCDEMASEQNAAALRKLDGGAIAERCTGDLERIRGRLREIMALARKYRLPVIGYEGGQHLATSGALHEDTILQQRLTDANRHPGMGLAYTKYLDMWRDEGGQLMLLYSLCEEPSIWGRWGLLESLELAGAHAPKYSAAIDFMGRQSRWWRDGGRQ